MAKTANLTIILVNYNTVEWIDNALRSIEEFANVPVKVVVVDNGSSDGSEKLIRKKYPNVELIQTGENLGFAKANNIPLRDLKTEFVMLMNSDAELTADTHLDKLIERLNSSDNIGVVSPKVVLPDGSLDLASHRGEPTPWAAATYFLKLEQLFPGSKLFGQYHQTWKNFDDVHEIAACSGAAMLLKKSVVDVVGLLDEQFFMYAEDLDWCKRIRDKGFTIIFDPSSTVIHHKYKSGLAKQAPVIDTDKHLHVPGFEPPKKTNDHFYDTMKQYYQKHYSSNSVVNAVIDKTVDLLRALRG